MYVRILTYIHTYNEDPIFTGDFCCSNSIQFSTQRLSHLRSGTCPRVNMALVAHSDTVGRVASRWRVGVCFKRLARMDDDGCRIRNTRNTTTFNERFCLLIDQKLSCCFRGDRYGVEWVRPKLLNETVWHEKSKSLNIIVTVRGHKATGICCTRTTTLSPVCNAKVGYRPWVW